MKRYICLILSAGLLLFAGCSDDNLICINNCDNEPNLPSDTPETPDTNANQPTPSQPEPTETPEQPTEQPSVPEDSCENGQCTPICQNGETLCDGSCVRLNKLHLADCTLCQENYCDTDNDLSNGCEAYALGNDAKHCGGCNVACDAGQLCSDGECVPDCPAGKTECNGACLNLSVLHLESCSACASGYCDADDDLSNGCETDAFGSDADNCGSCGHACENNEICSDGQCIIDCDDGETLCGDICLSLNDLHLASCNACSDGYCDTDGDLSNGCEVSIFGNDPNNCGGCGIVCDEGEACDQGLCYNPFNSHRRMILGTDSLNVRKGPGTEYTAIGSLTRYEYVTVTDEENGWYRFNYQGQEGWISGKYTMDAGDQYEGRAAIDYAEARLYTKTGYCTYDYLTHEPKIQYFYDLSSYNATYNYGYDSNCANFVTSVLQGVGLLSKHHNRVQDVYHLCETGVDGYHFIDFKDARAGDIWINKPSTYFPNELQHTELVIGIYNNDVIMIGSNNFSKGTDVHNLCVNNYYTNSKYSSNPRDYQRVSYGSVDTGYICTRRKD